MHEAALAQAALPAPSIVLGMLLRPYSLGHELLLFSGSRIGNHGSGLKYSALEYSVLVCSQGWEENRRINFSLWEQFKLRVWRARARRYRKPDRLAIEAAEFERYRIKGSLEFVESDLLRPGTTPQRTPGAPFVLRVHQFLMLRFGLSESRAWDYPFGLAKMRLQAFYEAEGTYFVKNRMECDFDEYCQREDAKESEKPRMDTDEHGLKSEGASNA